MSDHPKKVRRIPARIVPIGKVDSATIPPRRGGASAALKVPNAPTAYTGRIRPYGAPLAAATRLPRSLQRTAEQTGDPASASDDFSSVARASLQSVGERVGGGISLDQNVDAPLILWEQPPQPKDDSGKQTPAWMVDATQAPSEEDYAKLASQVGVMLAGFAAFARAPGVVESGNWHARLPMPDTVLPETVLEMQMTPVHAKLRFETDNQLSRGVLQRHAKTLQSQVKAALDDARVVEVVLW